MAAGRNPVKKTDTVGSKTGEAAAEKGGRLPASRSGFEGSQSGPHKPGRSIHIVETSPGFSAVFSVSLRPGGGLVDHFLFFSLWAFYGLLIGWVLLLLFQSGSQIGDMAGMTAAMSVGMTAGLVTGLLLPMVFHLPFFVSTAAGMGIGGGVGWIAGWRGGPAGILQGWLAGLMGGMMGAMLGVMVPPAYHSSLFRLMNVLFAGVLLLVFQLIRGCAEKDRRGSPIVFFLVVGLFLAISHFFPVGVDRPEGLHGQNSVFKFSLVDRLIPYRGIVIEAKFSWIKD